MQNKTRKDAEQNREGHGAKGAINSTGGKDIREKSWYDVSVFICPATGGCQ